MRKLNIKPDQLNDVLNKLAPAWAGCVDNKTIEDAQDTESKTRKWLFGTIINHKYIALRKPVCGFQAGEIVSIADIYDTDSASSIAGLIIYRLGHSGLLQQPRIVKA